MQYRAGLIREMRQSKIQLSAAPLLFITICLFTGCLPFLTRTGRNLEYEAATMQAAVFALLLPCLACFKVVRARLESEILKPNFHKRLCVFLIMGVSLTYVIPGQWLFWGGCQCSGPGYLFWYVLQVFPSFTMGAGLLSFFICLHHWRVPKKYASFIVSTLIILLVLQLVAPFILWPQKRLTHLLFGFLHGPIYDRFIAVDEGILLKRLSHTMVGGLLLALPWIRPTKVWRWFAGVYLAAFFYLTWLASSFPSQVHGPEKLEEYLNAHLVGEGLSVHFPESFRTDHQKKRLIQNLFQSARFHRQDLLKILGLSKPPDVKLYVYADHRSKKILFGAGRTDVTDVFSQSIHVTLHELPHPTLRHELVHALTSKEAFHGLGFHPNMAFTEGLAVALAPQNRDLNLDDASAVLLAQGKIPSLKGLFSPFFWGVSGQRAYTVAGSFLSFLIGKYGITDVLKIYGGAPFEQVMGRSLDNELALWLKKIQTRVDHAKISMEAEALYRSPGILNDRCPHTRALIESGSDAFLDQLRAPLGWNAQDDALHWKQESLGADKALQLQIWRRELKKVIRPKIEMSRRLESWHREIKELIEWPPKSLEDVELAILQSDLFRITGQQAESDEVLMMLKRLVDERSVGPDLLRQIFARIYLEEEFSPQIGLNWRYYLAGWGERGVLHETESHWLIHYLHLRGGSLKKGDYYRRLLDFRLPQNLPQTFYVEWFRYIARSFLKINEFALASRAYEKARDHSGADSRNYFDIQAKLMEYLYHVKKI